MQGLGKKKVKNFLSIIPQKSRDKVNSKLEEIEADEITELKRLDDMYSYSPYPSNPKYKQYHQGLRAAQDETIRDHARLSLGAIVGQLEEDGHIYQEGRTLERGGTLEG